MPNPENPVAARLEADRRALLDLSLRNPLLNHKPRARGLEIVGESPEQVVRCLVREGRRMTFLPAPETSPEGTAAPPVPADQADHKLQTALKAEPLRTRLLAVSYAARASVEEQGVNTLFLATGMLRWLDPGHGETVLSAPLVLVPVELERSSARERFRLRHTGGDVETNLSLAEKLKADFAIQLPEPPEAAEGDVTRYLDGVASAVSEQPGWSVDRAAVVLGFFSFGKFLMYRDLDPDVWPVDVRPADHPVIRALLRDGFPAPDDGAVEPDLDRVAPPERSRQVVDADGTQALALWDAGRGRSLVIQGPPGTGKSQTITNLIAAAVGAGKTVLFVAEKLAALDVVKRRLDAASVGHACLELHSHKTSKRAVLDELERTYTLGRPRADSPDDDRALLAETRERLNAYASAVHTPVGASGLSPFQAVGAVGRLRRREEGPPPPVTPDLSAATGWTPYERKRRVALVAELQACLAGVGVPRDHPFYGSRRTSWPPSETERLRERVAAAARSTERLVGASADLARFLRAAEPADRAGCLGVLLAARAVARSAAVQGVNVAAREWLSRRSDLHELIDAGRNLAALHARLDDTLLPAAWDEDLDEARQALNVDGRSWWRRLSTTYRRAARKVKGLCRCVPPDSPDELIGLADAVAASRRYRETIDRHEPLAAKLFEGRWQGERSHWDALTAAAAFAAKLHHDVRARRLPEGLVGLLAERPSLAPLRPRVDALKAALTVHHEAMLSLSELLEVRGETESPLPARPFAAQLERLAAWSERAADLPALVAFNRLAARCVLEGMPDVVDLAEVWPGAAHGLVAVVERRAHEAVIAEAFAGRPALAGFDASGHEQALREFGRLDRLALAHNRAEVARAHWERLPRREAGGQVGVLRREFEKKARHLPVRQLLGKAGRAVQAIKPVFLMSPLSVAAYLAPGGLEFDLVVFDEASQVRPVEALGAILRGKQTVVVGDSRQLPPTGFFDRLTGSADDEPEDSDDDLDPGESSEVESILGLFVAAGAPERMLRWHYRSRHESLIAVANREFYGGRLAVFPSPDAARRDSGLSLRHLPDTAYDRGGTRSNPGEAEAVALAVFEHARAQLARPAGVPGLTLGVAAFSVAQQQAILDALERLRQDDPGPEPFFDPNGPEPFFVKNLENVQGDERDVIYISIGYGRTAEGNLAMSFGPLNGEGGERRLNVLITRARVRCEVFTNLTAADIDLSRTRSRGVRALKTFLAYAQTGRLEPTGAEAVASAEDDFSRAVLEAAVDSGLPARVDVGAPGLAPDLAVSDAERPGRDVLGVLTDGPAEQAARPARDRDRLRPQVLESLGWRLQRVYSTDWARDPDGSLRRLREAARGVAVVAEVGTAPPVLEPFARDGPGESALKAPAASAYRLAGENGGPLELATADTAAVAARLVEVVRIEGPVHRDEADRRVAEGAGARRIGPRVQAALDEALGQAVASGAVVARGDFLWPAGLDRPPVRDRAALPPVARKLDLVAPEELALAVETVVSDALGMPPDDVPAAACRLLGFPRVSDDMRTRVDSTVARLLETGRLAKRGEHLVTCMTSD